MNNLNFAKTLKLEDINKLENIIVLTLDMYQKGYTLTRISDELKISYGTVINILEANNVERRPKGRPSSK